jgi:arsenate reductase
MGLILLKTKNQGPKTMKTVLFLCTGNSCRSIMAEALLNHYGGGKFRGLSAGSLPAGYVHKQSLKTLKARGISTGGFRSKSWGEFTGIPIDIVITVCDNAAGESCPIFPGGPLKTHWGVRDPAKFEGDKKETAEEFSAVCDILERRIQMLLYLDFETKSKEELKEKLDIIGTI